MKKVFVLLQLILLGKIGLACSCAPYEPNFYRNISDNTHNCIAVFDSLDYSYSFNGLPGQTARFILLDTIGSFESAIGDTIIVTGQDGLNCGELLNGFSRGDTLFLALDKGFYQQFEMDTFYLEGACGKHYLKITNSQHADLSITQIKEKISKVVAQPASNCNCYNEWENFSFYGNVSKASANILTIFQGYDYNFSHNNLITQTGYFKLLDTIGPVNATIGETIVVLGEDGVNCGEMLHRFLPGDTLFLALSGQYYEPFQKDTFYLVGGTCGPHFLKITNGEHNGLSISEIKDKIKSYILGFTDGPLPKQVAIFPNPTAGYFAIESVVEPVEKVEIFDPLGRLVAVKDNLNLEFTAVDMGHLPAGVYHVVIYTASGHVVKKIVKE